MQSIPVHESVANDMSSTRRCRAKERMQNRTSSKGHKCVFSDSLRIVPDERAAGSAPLKGGASRKPSAAQPTGESLPASGLPKRQPRSRNAAGRSWPPRNPRAQGPKSTDAAFSTRADAEIW